MLNLPDKVLKRLKCKGCMPSVSEASLKAVSLAGIVSNYKLSLIGSHKLCLVV